LALVNEGDRIRIDIPARKIDLVITDQELEERRNNENKKMNGWRPNRERNISNALKAYASMVSSADRGAIRLIDTSY
jgi:dihydroxy-acid dehydratase